MTTALGAAAANPMQVMENLPSSMVSMASAFGGGPAKDLKPAYGLVFRFSVKLLETEGTRDLGQWQSCGGLKMDFQPVEVKSGGIYTSVRYLPGELKYPKIVLKRAVDPKSSKAVQQWLKEAATSWINGATKDKPGDATITLFDPNNKAVLTWHVRGLRPSSWSGPDLDANSSKVAIETLELVHEGFEVVAGPQRAAPNAGPRPTYVFALREKESRVGVRFTNTPESITVMRTSEILTLPELAQVAAGQGTGPGVDSTSAPLASAAGTKVDTTKLKVGGRLYIEKAKGVDPVAKVDMLIGWMGSKGDSKTKEITAPDLVMQWGKFEREVKLSELTVDYVRFSEDGMPTRALIKSLTLTVIPKPPGLPTNPSSGGIPGRSAHTLTMDENLPLLANEHYGSPSRWRDIAEANGVDDPLRARAGTAIFLPATEELPVPGGRP